MEEQFYDFVSILDPTKCIRSTYMTEREAQLLSSTCNGYVWIKERARKAHIEALQKIEEDYKPR